MTGKPVFGVTVPPGQTVEDGMRFAREAIEHYNLNPDDYTIEVRTTD